MRILTALSTILLLGVAAGVAFGESEGSRVIQKGRWSLAFTLPDGGGATFGVWKMASTRSNLGLNIGVNHDRGWFSSGPDSAEYTQDRSFWNFSLQPSIKRYLALGENVSPYFFGAVGGAYGWGKSAYSSPRYPSPPQKSYNRSASLRLGLGVDWTPLDDISVGAFTGLNWTEAGSDDGSSKHGHSEFNTEITRLTMHVYF